MCKLGALSGEVKSVRDTMKKRRPSRNKTTKQHPSVFFPRLFYIKRLSTLSFGRRTRKKRPLSSHPCFDARLISKKQLNVAYYYCILVVPVSRVVQICCKIHTVAFLRTTISLFSRINTLARIRSEGRAPIKLASHHDGVLNTTGRCARARGNNVTRDRHSDGSGRFQSC